MYKRKRFIYVVGFVLFLLSLLVLYYVAQISFKPYNKFSPPRFSNFTDNSFTIFWLNKGYAAYRIRLKNVESSKTIWYKLDQDDSIHYYAIKDLDYDTEYEVSVYGKFRKVYSSNVKTNKIRKLVSLPDPIYGSVYFENGDKVENAVISSYRKDLVSGKTSSEVSVVLKDGKYAIDVGNFLDLDSREMFATSGSELYLEGTTLKDDVLYKGHLKIFSDKNKPVAHMVLFPDESESLEMFGMGKMENTVNASEVCPLECQENEKNYFGKIVETYGKQGWCGCCSLCASNENGLMEVCSKGYKGESWEDLCIGNGWNFTENETQIIKWEDLVEIYVRDKSTLKQNKATSTILKPMNISNNQECQTEGLGEEPCWMQRVKGELCPSGMCQMGNFCYTKEKLGCTGLDTSCPNHQKCCGSHLEDWVSTQSSCLGDVTTNEILEVLPEGSVTIAPRITESAVLPVVSDRAEMVPNLCPNAFKNGNAGIENFQGCMDVQSERNEESARRCIDFCFGVTSNSGSGSGVIGSCPNDNSIKFFQECTADFNSCLDSCYAYSLIMENGKVLRKEVTDQEDIIVPERCFTNKPHSVTYTTYNLLVDEHGNSYCEEIGSLYCCETENPSETLVEIPLTDGALDNSEDWKSRIVVRNGYNNIRVISDPNDKFHGVYQHLIANGWGACSNEDVPLSVSNGIPVIYWKDEIGYSINVEKHEQVHADQVQNGDIASHLWSDEYLYQYYLGERSKQADKCFQGVIEGHAELSPQGAQVGGEYYAPYREFYTFLKNWCLGQSCSNDFEAAIWGDYQSFQKIRRLYSVQGTVDKGFVTGRPNGICEWKKNMPYDSAYETLPNDQLHDSYSRDSLKKLERSLSTQVAAKKEVSNSELESGTYEIMSSNRILTNIVLEHNSKIKYYRDSNRNNQKDQGEDYVGEDDLKQLNISVNQSNDIETYNLKLGWNLVSFPMIMKESIMSSGVSKASELLYRINLLGGRATHVVTYRDGQFIIFSGRFDENKFDHQAIPELESWGDDFNLLPGEAYFIKNYRQISIPFYGQKVENSLEIKVRRGWNLLGIFNSNKQSYNGFEVIDQMNMQRLNITTLSSYDSGMYFNIIQEDGIKYGNDFKIEPLKGYWVLSKSDNPNIFAPE